MSKTGPPQQQMHDAAYESDGDAQEFAPLRGGGFNFSTDFNFNECCQVRCCCFQGGCHQKLELMCAWFPFVLNCAPFSFKVDTSFPGCLRTRLFCCEGGCHQACLEPTFQYFCLKCSF